MAEPRTKSSSEVLKRAYSEEEVAALYELARLLLENGDHRRAEIILTGITEAAPDFYPAPLAKSYIAIHERDFEKGVTLARQALRLEPESVPAMLFLASALLSTGDYNTSGTYLGEIGERIESGVVDHPNIIRFYRAQLVRYQDR